MTNIQEIIDDKLDEILDIIRNETLQVDQEPDHVILRELKTYFS